MSNPQHEDEIIGYLAMEGRARHRDIANALGLPFHTVSSILARLMEEGEVDRVSRGLYEYCGRWCNHEG